MYGKIVVVSLGAVLALCLICESEALDSNGAGVCVVKLSMPQVRRKSYNVHINKWCGRRKCIAKRYKTETYLTWTNQTVCCNGWQHDSELDVCSPICSTGCRGGSCVGPDLCRCDPPLYLDPELKNTCITPSCTATCNNASCVANNTCICNENYSRYNSTHCFQCGSGYTPDDTLKCLPVCEEPCVNSICSAPNICTCFEGYKPISNYVCEPICDCVNSACVAPNTCSCFDGYIPVNSTTCVPKCNNCSYGDCISPNNCSCHDGYERIDGDCKPKCSMCDNGFCSAPGVCSCVDGYVNSAKGCVKRCNDSCKGYCLDGVCVQRNCSVPIRGRAVHGTDNSVIDCCEDWDYNSITDQCTPSCVAGCPNGTCVDVNKCICTPPRVLENYACVIPLCDPPCINARCIGKNTCECNENYQFYNKTACMPKCDKPCINSTCTSPNSCTCMQGYKKKDNNTCVPKCSSPCENGNCIAPEICKCHNGYNKEGGICKPVCNSDCINGTCVGPNTCKCDEGYKLEVGSKFNCSPICEHKCDNAKCVFPNQCKCEIGYKESAQWWQCEPACDRCNNGTCVAPNNCTCSEGYVWKSFSGCIAVKAINCDKATCSSVCSHDGENYCCQDEIPVALCLNPMDEIPASLAGLELSWTLGGVVGLLMLLVVAIVMQRMWHNRKEYYEGKKIDNDMANGSVVYTLPHTLLKPRMSEVYEHDEEAMHEQNTDALLRRTDDESLENIRL